MILTAALLQGLFLYGLHRWSEHAPAAPLPWLQALYGIAIFLPTSAQLLAADIRRPALWIMLALLAGALLGFGLHNGARVSLPSVPPGDPDIFPLVLVETLWWLLVLPFLQAGLTTRRWTPDYAHLFRHSWRNVILLTESALFTGILWMILVLWATLFSMLGYGYFERLFAKPAFIYPVTTVAYGCALQLLSSTAQRVITGALAQLLNLLKWLACVAFALLAAFAVPLILSLPALLTTGHHGVSASWLLWLMAVTVLLLNAAWRDGAVEAPYPVWIMLGLRICLPLTLLVALTALYALQVRIGGDGLTVERVCALMVAGAALAYSLGYTFAALKSGRWLALLGRVNVAVALALIAVIGAALTPLLSPYRLAADSQYRRILKADAASSAARGQDPFQYLLTEAGGYGRERLTQLAALREHPQAEPIRARATTALQSPQAAPAIPPPADNAATRLKAMTLHPAGRMLDTDLEAALLLALQTGQIDPQGPFIGVFADLDADGTDEFVLLASYGGRAYGRQDSQQDGRWGFLGHVAVPDNLSTLQQALAEGPVRVEPPRFKDLVIGRLRLRVQAEQPGAPGPAPARP